MTFTKLAYSDSIGFIKSLLTKRNCRLQSACIPSTFFLYNIHFSNIIITNITMNAILCNKRFLMVVAKYYYI